MAKAETLIDQKLSFKSGRFVAYVKVLKVSKGQKFPEGLKVRCTLIDQDQGIPLLLLDNHEPFGYHIHTKLPEDSDYRISIEVKSYIEAVEIFLKQVERLMNYENK